VKKLYVLLLCLFATSSLMGELGIDAEFRTAAFFPSSHLFREIYGKTGVDYQLEASTKFQDCIDLWTNFSWYTKKGGSVPLHDPTRISIANVSIGLSYIYDFCNGFSIYGGVGPTFANIRIKNHIPDVWHEKVVKCSVGVLVKSGIRYNLSECYYLDAFADYLYQPKKFHIFANVGGFKPGLGIGMHF